MKKAFISAACILLSSFFINAQVMWQFNRDTVITWHYQEGDEFNSNRVNTDYWQYISWARSLYMNYEQQYYTDGSNLVQENGIIKLIAKREPVFAKTVDWKEDNDSLYAGTKFFTLNKTNFNFTSGILTSKKAYNKGYYECRFKLPADKGYWPAFWMHGGDPNEEIDVMEARSSKPNHIHVDTHCPNRCDLVWDFIKRKSFGTWIKTRTNFVEGFNVMACEWDEDKVKFYLNGEFIAISNVKFDVPKHIVINIAVPSIKGPFGPGPAVSDSGAAFEVDYVRVWNKQPTATSSANSIYTSVDTSAAPHSKSILRSKKKFFYGLKKNAIDEGFKITMSQTENILQLVVMGNVKKVYPDLILLDSSGKQVRQQKLLKMYNSIDLKELPRGTYQLLVTRKELKASAPIVVQ